MLPQLYHAHHRRNLEDLPLWLALAARCTGMVLELGCGTGRVLSPLAKAGKRMIGIDHDLSMLKFLKENIDPQIQPNPLILAADISRFNLSVSFPLVILPCNTYSTLDDGQRKACLRCVSRHLTPQGVFAMSVPNPQLLGDLPRHSDMELDDEFIHPSTGNLVQVSSSWERSKEIFKVTWIYDHLLADGTVERLVTDVSHRLTPIQTYLDEFEDAGLSVADIYGDYDQSAYTPEAAQLIILASPHRY